MLISLVKDGDVICCEESQVAAFESQGYERSDSHRKPSQSQPVSVAQPVPSGLVRMAKGDLELTADRSQVSLLEKDGWAISTGSSVAVQQPESQQPGSQNQPQFSLKDVLLALDPNSDDDWTADKLVKLAVLKELTGRDVSRAEVNEAWPGFNRDVLRAVQQPESQ